MSRKAGSKEFRDKLEERKGTEWYDSALKIGDLHDPRIDDNGNKKMYSGAEIRAEMRHGRGDMSKEDLTKKYESMYASGEINLNGNAKDYLKEHFGASLVRNDKGGGDGGGDDGGSTPDPTNSISKPVTPENSPNQEITVPGSIKPGVFGSQYQNINQDNDITTNITGNQNVVTNTQDNSIGQSGGNFTYADDYARGLKDRYILNLTNR